MNTVTHFLINASQAKLLAENLLKLISLQEKDGVSGGLVNYIAWQDWKRTNNPTGPWGIVLRIVEDSKLRGECDAYHS